MEEKCIFCAIIKKEIPGKIIYEDDKTLAFLDISPVNPGHTLVIPKEHHSDLITESLENINACMAVIKKISPFILRASGAKAYNLICNTGADSGQLVFHTHFHIIPRFVSDGHRHWKGKSYEEGRAEELQKKIVHLLDA